MFKKSIEISSVGLEGFGTTIFVQTKKHKKDFP